jgi:hypothetical protein
LFVFRAKTFGFATDEKNVAARVARFGRVFTYWAIVFFGQFFGTKGAQIFRLLFSTIKVIYFV